MAVQNLWISCVGSNIGGYWSTPKYANKLKSYLSLSHDEKCLGFFYLGVLDSKNFRKIKRKSINEKIQWFR
jgi:nitroreductase